MFNIYNRRYLGSKTRLLKFIEEIVVNNCKDAKVFVDLFGGTGVVGHHFNERFDIIYNDILKSNCTSSNAFLGQEKININKIRDLIKSVNESEKWKLLDNKNYYVRNFSDTYLSNSNLKKAAFFRSEIANLFNEKKINQREKDVLLTSLIYEIDRNANTVGHYDAFLRKIFKNDELFSFDLPEIHDIKHNKNNQIFNYNSNDLVKNITGDIFYLDPPYNSRQYSDAYHFLENIVMNDEKPVYGVAKKMDRTELKSKYCSISAYQEFSDLIQNIKGKYILLSYNNTGFKKNSRSNARISDNQIIDVLSKKGDIKIFEKSLNQFNSGKTKADNDHKERVFFCEVGVFNKSNIDLRGENQIIQSPLNYTGGKFKILNSLFELFPKNIENFYDVFCGGFNVGANFLDCKKVIGIDKSYQVIEVLEMIQSFKVDILLEKIEKVINTFNLSETYKNTYEKYGCTSNEGLVKFNKNGYYALRNAYNLTLDPLMLLVLLFYSFNNQIRFNSKEEFNCPVGKRDFNKKMRNKLISFSLKIKSKQIEFLNCDFREILNIYFNKNDFIYLDPPYFLGEATYNSMWDENHENDLYKVLDELNSRGIRFALSNVIEHKGRVNNSLLEWAVKGSYNINYLNFNYNNSNYRTKNKNFDTKEVLITNYN